MNWRWRRFKLQAYSRDTRSIDIVLQQIAHIHSSVLCRFVCSVIWFVILKLYYIVGEIWDYEEYNAEDGKIIKTWDNIDFDRCVSTDAGTAAKSNEATHNEKKLVAGTDGCSDVWNFQRLPHHDCHATSAPLEMNKTYLYAFRLQFHVTQSQCLWMM